MIRKAFKSTVVNLTWATLYMERCLKLCPPSLNRLLLSLYFVPGFLALSVHGSPSDICLKPRGKGSPDFCTPGPALNCIRCPASSFQGIRLKRSVV